MQCNRKEKKIFIFILDQTVDDHSHENAKYSDFSESTSSENMFQADEKTETLRVENKLVEISKKTEEVVSVDPAQWIIKDNLIKTVLKKGFCQILDIDFNQTKRLLHGRNRFLSKSIFTRTLCNGTVQGRVWLIYSKSTNALFCGPCKLFGEVKLLTTGYSHWSNAHQSIKEHEETKAHKTNVIKYLEKSKSLKEDIKDLLSSQITNEIQYWQNVLKRVVAVVKALASRGLPFRGNDERFGSLDNGNFMMLLEFISKFDPFLSNHIKSYGNAGRGSVSYLSTTICNEFIEIMARQLTQKIINEVKAAIYYSISVNSTPDLSHIDQLTFVIRYVDKTSIPQEHSLKFIPHCGHTGEKLADAVINTLNKFELDIKNCRGQSYDNARNMSGIYTGLQTRKKEINPLAEYVPCSAHSLNLVGNFAAECCSSVVHFFPVVQSLYNFFSASTRR